MSAEYLIALEATLAELGELYAAAAVFAPLRDDAENRLLPRLQALGAELRRQVRRSDLSAGAIERAAAEISALRDEWEARFGELKESPLCVAALAARQRDDQPALARLLPQLLADLAHEPDPPPLYAPFSPLAGRRRAGAHPFLSAAGCAERIAALQREGLPAVAGGARWWEAELASIELVADAALLDTPVALRYRSGSIPAAVFRGANDGEFRVFADRLAVPFGVVLQPEVSDEWWTASAEPYADFRRDLHERLNALGLSVETAISPQKG